VTRVLLPALLVAVAVLWLAGSRWLDRATRPGVWDAETNERTQLAPEHEDWTPDPAGASADLAVLARFDAAAQRDGFAPWGEGVTNDPETS
jgi:hypothetical protein